jgi:hypothetical protein
LFKKIFATSLSGILFSLTCGVQPTGAQTINNAEAAQVRTKVQSIGAGPKARVEVKLRNKSKVKGYVSGSGSDSFTIISSQTGSTETVAYADVAEVKKSGGGLKTLTWIILAGVAVTAVVVGATVIRPAVCDGGAGC